jgi:diketogulonate reductase-like aldo/keto reductase
VPLQFRHPTPGAGSVPQARNSIAPRTSARQDRLAEALGALRVNLSKSDLDAIEAIVPAGAAAGDRYNTNNGETT